MTTQAERRTAAVPAFATADAPASLGVLVVTYDNEAHLDRLLGSLRLEAASTPMRVVVVDNGSSDGTVRRARAHADVLTLTGHGNVGYAGGINVGLARLGDVPATLVLNADLVLEPGAVPALLARLQRGRAGIVLPLLLDRAGAVQPSLRREPSVTRSLGDAVLGRFLGDRPGWLSETVRDPTAYAWAHPVDWGTGAAMLVRAEAARTVGPWDERFFLYSEETDYCRRARDAGWEVWFEPAARVRHAAGGSGRGPELTALLQVNRVRYARKHHAAPLAAATLAVTAAASVARTWDAGHRSAVRALLLPSARRALPRGVPTGLTQTGGAAAAPAEVPERAPSGAAAVALRAPLGGAVVVPAHDEAAVIGRTLAGLAPWARAAGVEVVVVCNGCRDATAAVARRFPGVRVLEIPEASKPRALDAGDRAVRQYPRVYLDADVAAVPAAVAATLRALAEGPWLAARPPAAVDLAGASAPVRAFHRARARLAGPRDALWGAGVYGLSERGHARLGRFPDVLADDLWVDALFAPGEKGVVDAPPVRVVAPRTARSLVRVLARTARGTSEVRARTGAAAAARPDGRVTAPPGGGDPGTTTPVPVPVRGPGRTAGALLRTVRGPRSALDAAAYAVLVTLGRARARARSRAGRPARWERDESSRR
ncbi:glycosyltransferase family 2 protein [Cellulomonas sp. ACRRI]|uniref:glycosyltransferase family 2 protein n=1 Tax=Cellulomonas sp. ACRRI TaxID=2918188 RepID=UPI001EF1BE6E|nr:glycosyltransferase family 2 protein [Cellulomonas sp. ACRRI]MCG7288064.1 glycosyltransferase family 2 protein [Cellulomonas sp. ACRRI]